RSLADGALAPSCSQVERIVLLFDVLGESLEADGYAGCGLLKAAAEDGGGDGIGARALAAFRRDMRHTSARGPPKPGARIPPRPSASWRASPARSRTSGARRAPPGAAPPSAGRACASGGRGGAGLPRARRAPARCERAPSS